MSTLTLREQRQITLPAEVVAAVGLRVNDELDVRAANGDIHLASMPGANPRRPAISRFLGATAGLYGQSAEEADAPSTSSAATGRPSWTEPSSWPAWRAARSTSTPRSSSVRSTRPPSSQRSASSA